MSNLKTRFGRKKLRCNHMSLKCQIKKLWGKQMSLKCQKKNQNLRGKPMSLKCQNKQRTKICGANKRRSNVKIKSGQKNYKVKLHDFFYIYFILFCKILTFNDQKRPFFRKIVKKEPDRTKMAFWAFKSQNFEKEYK